MTQEHLELLDFILPLLSDIYDDSDSLNKLILKYKKKTGNNYFNHTELKHFLDLYNLDYFEHIDGTIDYIKINPETKEIIDHYGSLSLYFKELEKNELENNQIDVELKVLQIKNAHLLNDNLKLQNKHLKRYILYAIIGFIAGIIATNWKYILILINIMDQE